MMTSHFLLYSSYSFELRSILRVPASKYFIGIENAGSNLDFPELSLKDGLISVLRIQFINRQKVRKYLA